jgi:hypothetical protein
VRVFRADNLFNHRASISKHSAEAIMHLLQLRIAHQAPPDYLPIGADHDKEPARI